MDAPPPGQWAAIVRETFDNYAWVLPGVCIRQSSKTGAETIGENAFFASRADRRRRSINMKREERWLNLSFHRVPGTNFR